jgi:hypothetical protein
MYEIATVLSILGFSLLLNKTRRWPVDTTFLFVVTTIIIVLYLAGLISLLQETAATIMFIGISLFIIHAIFRIKDKNIAEAFTSGVVFFLAGSVILCILTNTHFFSYFTDWDDFSHWARTSKIIYLNNGLVGPGDPVSAKDYPPGTSLFHYYVYQISGFLPQATFFAQGIIILAAFSQILVIVKNQRLLAFLILIFFYFLSHSLSSGLHGLSVDIVVAVLFGSSISLYWISGRSSEAVIRTIPVVIALPVIKAIGLIFSCIIIMVVITDRLLAGKSEKSSAAKRLFLPVMMILLLAMTYGSWQSHVNGMGVGKTFNADISVEKLWNSFQHEKATERQNVTKKNYIDNLLGSKTILSLITLLLVAAIMIRRLENDNHEARRLYACFFWMFGGLVFYLVLLLVLYMFFFNAFEGVRLASFDRYALTYLIGIDIVIFAMMLNQYMSGKYHNSNLKWFCVVYCVLSASIGLKSGARNLVYAYSDANESVHYVTDLVFQHSLIIEKNVPDNRSVYFIWQDSVGFEMQIFNYSIIPRKSNNGCWTIGEPYYAGDVWTCNISISEFREKLHDYDYLLVASADSLFWNRFGEMFDEIDQKCGGLYRVPHDAGKFQLIKTCM